MKIKIKQSVLLENLNYVIRGISSKNLIPILNCIKLSLTKDGLYLMSNNTELAIKSFIDKKNISDIYEEGEIVVTGRYLYDIVRKLPDEDINIESAVDDKLLIYTNSSSFNLNCNKVADFPKLEMEMQKKPICIDKVVFKNIVNQTAFAASTSEKINVLTGINIKITNSKLECVATDSYRLARKQININYEGDEINIIIPTKNLLEIMRMINDDSKELELHIFNNKIIFVFDNNVVLSRLINGKYPDISKVIAPSYLVTFTCDYDKLYNSIDRASLLTNEANDNTIKLQTKKDKLLISSNIPEIGNVEETLDINKEGDDDIIISFSSKFVLEALKAFTSSNIMLMFNNENTSFIIRDSEDDSLIQLIMPKKTY